MHVAASVLTFFGHNGSLLRDTTLWTLKLFAVSLAISLVIAVPLGVWLGHVHRGSFLAINVSNVGRALPSLAVISIGIPIFGIGFTDVTVALIVLSVPVILTNAYVAVDGVDPEVVEAARGMGMSELQVLFRAELPLALPLIFAGIRTAALYTMATTPLAGVAGAPGGLGDIISNQASYRFEGVVAASLVIIALAFAAEGVFALVQRRVTPPGMRTRMTPAIVPPTETL